MKVNELIESVSREVPFDYMLDEYNYIVRELCLMLPDSDAETEVEVDENGEAYTGLNPRQIRHVYANRSELLRSSHALVLFMPEEKLYHAVANKLYVTCDGKCTILYRTVPSEVTAVMAMSEEVYGDALVRLLVRAYLERCAYQYVGDFESADAFSADYNAKLEDYKKINGVIV